MNSHSPPIDWQLEDSYGGDNRSNSSQPTIGLIIFDGLVPPHFNDPEFQNSLRRYTLRTCGFQDFSVLYLLDTCCSTEGIEAQTYLLSQSLAAPDAINLALFSVGPSKGCLTPHPQSASFNGERKRIAVEIVEVCSSSSTFDRGAQSATIFL